MRLCPVGDMFDLDLPDLIETFLRLVTDLPVTVISS